MRVLFGLYKTALGFDTPAAGNLSWVSIDRALSLAGDRVPSLTCARGQSTDCRSHTATGAFVEHPHLVPNVILR